MPNEIFLTQTYKTKCSDKPYKSKQKSKVLSSKGKFRKKQAK